MQGFVICLLSKMSEKIVIPGSGTLRITQPQFQNSMEKFGCTTPWGPNKDHICKNETLGMKAHHLYKEYFIWQNATGFLKQCPKSCEIMKLQLGNVKESVQPFVNGKASSSLHIKFHEIITITNDQYSYIWLNLIAEVGGYVGLFLGFSVFQITDLIDKILQKFCH